MFKSKVSYESIDAGSNAELCSLPTLARFFNASTEKEMNDAYPHVYDFYQYHRGLTITSLLALCVSQNKTSHFDYLLRKKTNAVLGYTGSASFLLKALSAAIDFRRFDLVERLLAYNAVARHLHSFQNRALQVALRAGHVDLVSRLLVNDNVRKSLEKNEDGTALVFEAAIESGKPELLQLMLDSFVLFREPTKHDRNRWSGGHHILHDAFYAAGSCGSIVQLEKLLALEEYRQYFLISNVMGMTLRKAIEGSHYDMVCYLMENFETIRAREIRNLNSDDYTALSLYAIRTNRRTWGFPTVVAEVLPSPHDGDHTIEPSGVATSAPVLPAVPVEIETVPGSSDGGPAIEPSLVTTSAPSVPAGTEAVTEPSDPGTNLPLGSSNSTFFSAETSSPPINSAKLQAIEQLQGYYRQRSNEADYTSFLGGFFRFFGTFSKQEKCDAVNHYIEVLNGTRAFTTLPVREQQALSQGRLGEEMREVQRLTIA